MSPYERANRCTAALPALLFAALLGFAGLARAAENFSLQGFGTLGAVRTDSNAVEFVRDLSQARGTGKHWSAATDSALGVQASWQPVPQWQVVVQALSRYRHDRSFRPEIAWAFVKYEPTPNLSLRAGRLGTEFFMLADSRWVGYSFLTVRPPGDYFWYLPFYSIHGADATLNLPLGEGVVRSKLFYGRSNGSVPLSDEQWEIRGSPMLGGYLEYQSGAWQLRASYANLRFRHDLPLAPVLLKEAGIVLSPADGEFLRTRGTRSHYYSLGLVYDEGPLQAHLMLNHIDQGSNALESSDGGFALLGYRMGAWTPYLGYSWVYSRADRKAPSPVTAYVVGDSHTDQKTVFAGVRWDFARNVALKAQWDGIRGEADSYFPYRQDHRAEWNGRLNVFSMSLDFVF